MMHKPIQIKNLDLSFPLKTIFENFNCQITYGSRIAIIGRNGSGKSTLLKIIAGHFEPNGGAIIYDSQVSIGYVPQLIEDYTPLSGGERFNMIMTRVLSLDPNVLLLDEPTNHLDYCNRKNLLRLLQHYKGTLIIASHDTELMRSCIDSFWHIDNGKIIKFTGSYSDYIDEVRLKRSSIEVELQLLNRQKRDMHNSLAREQQHAAKSKRKGEKKLENRKWLKMVGDLKGMKAEKSQGKKFRAIDASKRGLESRLAELRLPEVIIPKFSIKSFELSTKALVQIRNGTVGYSTGEPLLTHINLSINGNERIAISGDNGSGKSTLVKAILGGTNVLTTGDWYVIKRNDIGYLDQHYNTLDPNKSVFETIVRLATNWSHTDIRCHLNDFLFRKNEEVTALVSTLSGGEKVRLCLAQIAVKPSKLLVLDEITNNLDLETCNHVMQVLKAYPGALIVISHDMDFLKDIGVDKIVDIEKFKVKL